MPPWQSQEASAPAKVTKALLVSPPSLPSIKSTTKGATPTQVDASFGFLVFSSSKALKPSSSQGTKSTHRPDALRWEGLRGSSRSLCHNMGSGWALESRLPMNTSSESACSASAFSFRGGWVIGAVG